MPKAFANSSPGFLPWVRRQIITRTLKEFAIGSPTHRCYFDLRTLSEFLTDDAARIPGPCPGLELTNAFSVGA